MTELCHDCCLMLVDGNDICPDCFGSINEDENLSCLCDSNSSNPSVNLQILENKLKVMKNFSKKYR